MSQLSITINGRNYSIACEDGQEEHLTKLAGYLDMRVGELVGAVGQVGEARLLLMAALLVADELSDVYAELATYRNQAAQADAGNGAIDEEAAAAALEGLAARIEAIATRLEGT